MVRRPLNRALGHTSLELKCLFLFGAFLVVVIAISFFLYWRITHNVVNKQNPATGRILAGQAMLLMHLEGFEEASPDPVEAQNFALVVDGLIEELNRQQYSWSIIVPPNNPKAAGDGKPLSQFEWDLVRRWSTVPPRQAADGEIPEYEDRLTPSGDFYEYFQAVRAEGSCFTCHPSIPFREGVLRWNPTGLDAGRRLSEGDLAAIVRVSIPNVETREAVSLYWNRLLAVAIVTAFFAMIAFYVTIRYVVVRPLRHLRDVSNAIGRGNIAMRADIHTGDEFEALGVAFNRMMRHLMAAHHELRRANTQLDGKVDELAQANMQLYEMNRVKSDFMATMSHELRTPLNSILGFSDVLGSGDSLDDKQLRYVQNIRKSGQMLLEMINNILDMAKIESGKMEIQLSDFDVAQLVATQCDLARPLAERKNIDLETQFQPNLIPMFQDQSRVFQIVNNLLSNAIKFTPEGGRILVAVERSRRKELVLDVTDTGVGIAEEEQQTIFEKFRQGSTAIPSGNAFTREYSGTGLGLSIVKELCRLLGGEVSVQSALGTGSTFTVRLPWKLDHQPRLESPLLARFEQLGKPRFDPKGKGPSEPVAAGKPPSPGNDRQAAR
ncbi:MAG: ATP-binding protein [Planctomycetota bacterium]|jgi:signal transduction histidine kinase